jgi:hypothetical protein
VYFLGQYFLKRGVLDGHAGLQYAMYKFWYFSTVRLLIFEQSDRSGIAASDSLEIRNASERPSIGETAQSPPE